MIKKLRHFIFTVISMLMAGNALAQTYGQFVIKREISGTVHYLAHVKNASNVWELQDATSFSPNCLWYSDSGNKNYFFYDGSTPRYLAAPLEGGAALRLSTSVPTASDLGYPEHDYYFYRWDSGLGRGVQYFGVTQETCVHEWYQGECWEVYWVACIEGVWKMSEESYGITPEGGHYYSVTATEHHQDTTTTSGGLTSLMDFEMEFGGTPKQIEPVITSYSYSYTPAYTEYVINEAFWNQTPNLVTHNYWGDTDHGSDTPNQVSQSGVSASSRQWTLTGEGAEFLSFASGSNVTISTDNTPTVYYRTSNNTGHKTALLTLTVTYSNGAKQRSTATITVKTPCQNPGVIEPVVKTYTEVTVSWHPTADGYTVLWQKDGASDWNTVNVGSATSYTFKGLDFNTTYNYKVKATCDPATDEPTPYSFTTLAEPNGSMLFGAVFGGGRMANVGGTTEVIIVNCDSIHAVYGGNDIAGIVEGSNGSTITLGVNSGDAYATAYNGGSASTKVRVKDVYGGGNGYYTYDGINPGVAVGTTELTGHTFSTGVTEVGGSTSYIASGTIPTITKTSITVTNNTVQIDSLFGGAKNAFLTDTDNDVNITIKGGTVFSVFGGNNYGGTLGENSTERISVVETSHEIGTNYHTKELGRDFGIGYLFGGGNKVQGQNAKILITGGQMDTIFGGGNSADVRSTELTVNCKIGTKESDSNFGNIFSDAIDTFVASDSSFTLKSSYPWNLTGIYNIRALFGGNNQATMVGVPDIKLYSGSIGTVYGGGNAGDMEGDGDGSITFEDTELENFTFKYGTHVVMDSLNILVDYLYGGCQMSNVKYSTWVELKRGHVGTVYGGCNISGDVGSTRVDPSFNYSSNLSEAQKLLYQQVLGATYVKAGGSDNDSIVVHNSLFAGSNGFYNCSQDGIHYNNDTYYDDPSGSYAGMTVPTHNETHAIISKGATIKDNVYAGGNLASVGFDDNTGNRPDIGRQFPELVGLASVRMDGGTVEKNVYGGGNMASIFGVNEVRVSSGTIGLGLYGGNDCSGQVAEKTNRILPANYTIASDGKTSLDDLGVKTYVGVKGTPTIGTVYGGGNGDYVEGTVDYCYTNYQPIQAYTFVDIHMTGGENGGYIGTVYGGGNGVTVRHGATVFLNNSGNEDYDNVGTIFGGNNKGNLDIVPNIILAHGRVGTVYGGCNQGAMVATGKDLKTIDGYTGIGSYVQLRDTYVASADSTHTVTAKVSNAVYGGCRMNNVDHNSLVLVEGGVHTGVQIFGGCDISGTVDTARVVISGTESATQITNAYGGGNGNYTYSGELAGKTPPHCNASGIEMLGGFAVDLYAGSYAGSCDSTFIVMANGTAHDVFGGGYGETSTVSGNVSVNIGDTISGYNPKVRNNVYGGSALGTVNTNNNDLTTVNVLSGKVIGDVYGGGLGVPNNYIKGNVNGKIVVNIGGYDAVNDTLYGNAVFGNTSKIFGCNDAGGSPQDDVTVNIYSTGHDDDDRYPQPVPSNPEDLVGADARNFAIQAVYGGGDLANYAPKNLSNTATVHIWGCDKNTVKDVFGGSNKASAQNTHVIIDGGRIDRTFGGGNGQEGPADVIGTATTDITAGLIAQVFGGSNKQGNIGSIVLNITQTDACAELINEVFSGSNEAPLYGDVVTNLVAACYDPNDPNSQPYGNYYGGTNLATIYGDVTLNVYGGYYNNVFGGSKGQIGPTHADSISANIRKFPTIAEVEADPENYQPDPDGLIAYLEAHNDNLSTHGGNVTLNIYGGKIANAFGGSDVLGNIEGKITVNVEEGGGDPTIVLNNGRCNLDLFNVYGGGKMTVYNPTYVEAERLVPEVNIINGNVQNNVFGGGLGATATVVGNPLVTIGDITKDPKDYKARVGRDALDGNGVHTTYGNVYGGGELAQVQGYTRIVVQQDSTIVKGTVYGGGMGSMSGRDFGLITDSTIVEMRSGQVQRSIYGGGELGSVGTFESFYETSTHITVPGSADHIIGEPKTCKKGTGLAKVLISGGMVGINKALMPRPTNPTSYDDYGFVFCASKGALSMDSIANLLAVVDSTYLEISKSAVITASVYGGSENGLVLRNTHVKVTGGQIGTGHYKEAGEDHWDDAYSEADWNAAIAKVRAGTFTDADADKFHECDAWPFGEDGKRFVYDYYARYENNGQYYYDEAYTKPSNGGSYLATDGHSFYGHVFGGGSGYYPADTGVWRRSAGRVGGDTYVEITGGHILTNVYGGNEITDVMGHSKVEMSGGTLGVPRSLADIEAHPVNSYLFGAGMGDPRQYFIQRGNVGSAEVIVRDSAVIFGSVFGGGEDGHVLGDAKTTISGNAVVGTFGSSGVDGNIFGSGRGFSTFTLPAGVVRGNVELTICDSVHILGSVFGGGRMAAVGTDLDGVLISGSEHGNVVVNITGGIIGNLARIDTSKYSIGDVFGGSKGTLLHDWAKNQKLGLVKNTTVNISQPAGKTTRIYGSVYGGGEIASVGNFHYATEADTTAYNPTHPTEPMAVGDVYSLDEEGTGIAKIIITGGTIGYPQDTIFAKGHVFGSCLGKSGDSYSGYSYVDSTYVKLDGGTVYSSIFGGGENGHVLHNTNVLVKSGTVGIRMDTVADPPSSFLFQGNVYGGGRGIDEDPNDNSYCITAGKVSGNTNVTVEGGTIYRNVYGGGSFASVGDPDENPGTNGSYRTGLATVTISGGQIGTDGGKTANHYASDSTLHRNSLQENGFVFGSGRGLSGEEGSIYDSLAYTNNTQVTIEGTAYVTGSVFGGGENGHVKNNALVTVNADNGASTITESISTGDFTAYPFASSGKEPYPVIGYPLCRADMVEDLENPRVIYRGNVYGGGRGIDPKDEHGNLSKNAGVVYGNAEVHINGGTVRHNVYGGGSVASVGTLTYDHSHNDSVTGILTGTGRTHVYITGGIIGIDTTLAITKEKNSSNELIHNLAGINNGQVYGGGRGRSGEDFKNLAYVDSTHMIISGGVIYGAVFGGGCNGHVKRNTYVQMTGGTIGHTLTPTEKVLDFTHNTPVYFGNVYGGGRGIDHANLPTTICRTAGQVYGNTKVEISGGRVHHNIYGGGSLANVGDERFDSQGNVIGINSGGYATVTITGTAIIGTDGQNAGHVYGSGRGMAGTLWSDMAYVDKTFVTIGTKNGSDNPQVRGSVFGGGSDGHVEEDTDVKIYTGTIGTKLTAAEMVEIDPDPTNPNPETRPQIYRGNVYGGGRGVERSISGGQIQLDATAGRVFGNTNVLVEGGTIYHNIYGGGSLASVGTFTTDATGNHFTDGTGKATITITNGEIGMSPTNAESVSGATHSGLNSGQVYGSGRGEAGTSFANFAFTNATEVNVSGGNIYGAVFGGGENGHVQTSTQVNISGGIIGFDDGNENQPTYNIYRGNVYGGGRGIDIDTATMTVSPTAGKVYGNTEVNISGGTVFHNVYGGGSLASVGTATGTAPNLTFSPNTGKATINISGGQIGTNSQGNGRVFGAGRGYPDPDLVNLTYVDNTYVNILDGATIKGCVFGSGDNGQVYGDTHVTMSGGIVGTTGSVTDGNLFGSGRGVDTYIDGSTPTLNVASGLVHGNTHVTMSGGTIKNNLYGGGYMASVTGNAIVTVSGSATVGVASNTNGGKVFGAGCGVDVSHSEGTIPFNPTFAKINGNTSVIINDVHVNILSNVYGGGLKGAVAGNTNVSISDATLNNVYGAGQGVKKTTLENNADVCQGTHVTITSGTITGSVYGGGEFGSVGIPFSGSAPSGGAVSTVNVEGGHVVGSAFGGGNLGFNNGPTFMNLSGDAVVDQNIFGGAYGSLDTVYVAGLHTVNMRGGTVYGNVYGGSRNADDALAFNGSYELYETDPVSIVNISGGHAVNHVFASGYFGKAYGTVLAFIGTNAIMNAPNNTFHASDPIYNETYYNTHTALIIDRDVWAGADYGDFTAGQFGNPTISGQSNIYIDGSGYDTENATPTSNSTYSEDDFMILRNSIYGCGTSCDAATPGNRHIIVRNYGKAVAASGFDPNTKTFEEPYTGTTRDLYTIQRADNLIIDNSNINLIGQGIVNSFNATEKYSIHEFDSICVVNNSSVFINKPLEQIHKLGSYTCPDIYASDPQYTVVPYDNLDPSDSDTYVNNKIRVNQGTHLSVVYRNTTGIQYGELEGYFFIMTDGAERTLAFARPKQSDDPGNSIGNAYNNENDGGFVSYHSSFNTFDASGVTVAVGVGIQIPYDNHAPSRAGEDYFRVWRYSDPNVSHTLREGVLNAIVQTGDGTSPEDFYRSQAVRITLPPAVGEGSYYKIQQIIGEGCNITYGTEYVMVNAGIYDIQNGDSKWMFTKRNNEPVKDTFSYNPSPVPEEILEARTNMRVNPNNEFGLVAVPVSGLESSSNKPWLICNASAEEVLRDSDTKWINNDDNTMPEIDFYLTYSNAITGNNVWDPVVIFIEQYEANNPDPIDEVEIRLTITTITDISQAITSQTYALMFGDTTAPTQETYTTKLLLPAYNVQGPNYSVWTLEKAEWLPETGFDENTLVNHTGTPPSYVGDTTKVAMTFNPSLNFDNSNGWHNNPLNITPIDVKTTSDNSPIEPIWLGETDGRNPISFNAILYFDATQKVQTEKKQMGTVELTLKFTNQLGASEPQELKIRIEVWRKGDGERYYIDGINGAIAYDGTRPDAAKPNLANILYFTHFSPGDVIYIVNKVTVTAIEEREWNGQTYNKLNFYRYDGGHSVYGASSTEPHYEDYDYTNNPAYLGPLIDVQGKMSISSSLIDGSYNGTPYPGHSSYSVKAEAPLINVSDGGELTLIGGTIYTSNLQNNYNKKPTSNEINAGAINIEAGGAVKTNNYVFIENNYVEGVDGGGVYLEKGGSLLLSDHIIIDNNKKVNGDQQIAQNVYIEDFDTNIDIGTPDPNDIFENLASTSKVGITKTDWSDYDYMPVLYARDGEHLANLHCKDIVFDDQGIYRPEIFESADPAVANPENHLFFVKTWTTEVRNEPSGFDANSIDTPQELAWAISLVNGLNRQTATPTSNFTLTGDIDMKDHIWDVIGNTDIADSIVYSGVFEGNGHTVKGIQSQLTRGNMGMFGKTVDATIRNLIVETDFKNGTADTLGALAGTMEGGVISNIEALGSLKGKGTKSIGGVIGQIKSGTLHSSFAVDTIEGSAVSIVGGLTGINNGLLYNSYSNIALGTGNAATSIGGLAGINNSTIENCYVEFQGTEPSSGFGWFANTNSGTINYCYSPYGKTQYCIYGTPNSGYGTYDMAVNRKDIGYLYDDNKVRLSEPTNPYYSSEISYLDASNNHMSYITCWPGMVSVLNQWVKEKNAGTETYSKWFRPISPYINHDLPVLAFSGNNAMAALDDKPDLLKYGNLDELLDTINKMNADASIFLYDDAIDVANVPDPEVKVSINEDVALLQLNSASAFNNAIVGITFDNSSRKAQAYGGVPLEYDWHLMSTPLSNAKTGATYGKNGLTDGSGNYLYDEAHNYQNSPVDIFSMENSYFPNGLTMNAGYDDVVKWDFYSYYEPEYHWINLKRNKKNHFHHESIEGQILDRPFQMDVLGGGFRHYQILYTGYTGDISSSNYPYDQADNTANDENCVFVPGKGYMMAISQESYMNSTGTLNHGTVTIPVTAMAPDEVEGVTADRGSNLVGNPYQAYLDLDTVSTSEINVGLNKFWVYDADVDSVVEGVSVKGLYKPYTKGASLGADIPSRFIHPHQAFFVVYTPGSGESNSKNMVFTQSMATDKKNDYSYFRSGRSNQPAYPLVNLYVTDSLGNADLAIVEFNRPEVGGVKKIDNLRNAEFKLYAHFNNEDYGLLFTPRKTARIPVFFKTPNDGTYTLSWNTHNGTFSTMRLIDNLTGINYDMLANDHYTFDAQATDYASRFYIVFSVTDVEEFEDEPEIFAYFNGEGWVINGQGRLELVDMLGQVLYADNLYGEPTIVHFDDFAAGVYMLRLVSSNKILKAQKIVIQ